jgi:ribonuclease HI
MNARPPDVVLPIQRTRRGGPANAPEGASGRRLPVSSGGVSDAAAHVTDEVEIWTDGACSGNPGPGGWAAVLCCRGVQRELSGGDPATTNNRMEMTAVLQGLRALTRPVAVTVVVDSAYVEQAFTQGWIDRWRRNGWRTSAREPVKNRDLWEQLAVEVNRHRVRWRRVKGHAGNGLNDLADRLAVEARDRAAAGAG